MAEILIVEDATLQQTIIQQFIQPPHTVVGFTATESEAVELTEKHDPGVVIMDINLAEGDGIEAAKRIKATNPEMRIIMSTAVVSDEIKQLTQEIPVDDYLTKPYSKPELLEAIEDITD
jgi:two-component system chemotaxis response regulator CheY